jgi:hypothetical protein
MPRPTVPAYAISNWNGVEKPSLVFVRAPDRTVHGDAALQQWCEQNLNKLESGKVVEANVSART